MNYFIKNRYVRYCLSGIIFLALMQTKQYFNTLENWAIIILIGLVLITSVNVISELIDDAGNYMWVILTSFIIALLVFMTGAIQTEIPKNVWFNTTIVVNSIFYIVMGIHDKLVVSKARERYKNI